MIPARYEAYGRVLGCHPHGGEIIVDKLRSRRRAERDLSNGSPGNYDFVGLYD
jgi:hypothetical protein